jgi:hypothetical protein
MVFRTTDTVLGHSNAANILNGRFAPILLQKSVEACGEQ